MLKYNIFFVSVNLEAETQEDLKMRGQAVIEGHLMEHVLTINLTCIRIICSQKLSNALSKDLSSSRAKTKR